MSLDLFGRPALLFLPANRQSAVQKARESRADIVVLDLEDAVPAEHKVEAREAVTAAVRQKWPMPVGIRVNAGSEEDMHIALESNCDFIVIPKAEEAIPTVEKPLLAMVETQLMMMSGRSRSLIVDCGTTPSASFIAEIARARYLSLNPS